ncbi:hypothetical protein GTO10_06670 [Candidatus Saccharibacteria bacterium]|nr:hypothetical protein [Candidatus Saccharibacteria bacterium]
MTAALGQLFAKLILVELYSFAATTRKAISYAAIGAVVLLILYLLVRGAISLYLTINPPPPTPPTVGFGELPELRLPQTDIAGTPTFVLETATGDLPEFPDKAEVVTMSPVQPTLLGEEKARELARELDFGGQGSLSTDRKTLTFEDAPDGRTLSVDVVTQNFTLTTSTSKISSLPLGSAVSGPDAIKKAQILLSSLGLLEFGFEEGNQTTVFRAVSGGEAKKVSSISEAHFTEVNFFRSLTQVSSQNYPLLPPNPQTGLIKVWVTSGLDPEILNTLLLSYNASQVEIDKEVIETYPLEAVSNAWEAVKRGEGIAYVEDSDPVRQVAITRVTLAYFDDPAHQVYLQPIYVFYGLTRGLEGQEGEFVAYQPAVSKDWIAE